MRKRTLSLLLALVLVIGLLPLSIQAEALTIKPYLLIIEEYEDHVEITGYSGYAEEVVIPAQIDDLPVTVIGEEAFRWCNELTSIVLPDTITHIQDYAFASCYYLSSINIPDNLASIGRGAFEYCTHLTDISIPASVTSIGENAFRGCFEMTGIHVAANNPNYSSDSQGILFDKEKTTLIQAPAAITGFCVIPNSVTEIADSAFQNCYYLTGTKIPDGVTRIGDEAFSGCANLTDISIPENVTQIGNQAFYICGSLTGIYVDANNPNYSSDSRGILFDKAKTMLIQAPARITGSYAIPSTVTEVADTAFEYCYDLTDITIPDSVTYISGQTFFSCRSLTRICVDANNPNYSSDSRGVLFDKEKRTLILAPAMLAGSYEIPDSVTDIGYEAFDSCTSLTSISIPQSVTSICDRAFGDCTALTSIRFLGDAPLMAEWVFLEVTATAYYPADNATWTEDVMQDYCGTITWVPYNPDNPFTDVPVGSYFEEPVLWALENNITTGTSATTFSPGGLCLRAHVVTFLHRSVGSPAPTASNPFTDVKSSDFFYAPVLWAVENGITNGVSATEFGSGAVCNRAAVVTFLWRAAGSPEPESTVNPFTDVKPTDFFYKSVLWAVENGITNGLSATEFGPGAACNRAQVVTFLYRANN